MNNFSPDTSKHKTPPHTHINNKMAATNNEVVSPVVEPVTSPVASPAAPAPVPDDAADVKHAEEPKMEPKPEPKMIPNPKFAKQVAMSGNYKITAWREAAKRLGHLKPKIKFNAIGKADTEEYEKCMTLCSQLVGEWTVAGAIPEECRSIVTAPEMIDEAVLLNQRQKRKKIRETRRANKAEREKLQQLKKEAEERGEEFVMPKKKRPSRKRKAEPEEKVGEEKSADGDKAEEAEKKPKAKRAPRKKKAKVESEQVPPLINVDAANAEQDKVAFQPITPEAKADFLPSALDGIAITAP
jgi:hypothetical protein